MQINLPGSGSVIAPVHSIAATSGIQYFGEGSIFDGTSTGGNIVEDGSKADVNYLGSNFGDIISGGSGNDTIDGWKGNDLLYGGKGNDTVKGGSGSDTIIVSSGNDVYSGGNGGSGAGGIDTLDYSLMKGNLTLDLGHHTGSVGSGNSYNTQSVAGFEVIVGTTSGTDHVRGDHWANTFVSAGADNTFRGGLGNDVLIGGTGVDTYVLTKKDLADGSTKSFYNFEVGHDKLDVSNFLKGSATADQVFRFVDMSNGDSGHSTQVQALVGKNWVNMINLVGVDQTNVGADHHHLTLHDLGIL